VAGAFIWYELMTGDPAAAAPFYRAVIGWEIAPEGNAMPNGSEYRMIARSTGGHAGGVLTITADMAAHGAKPGWFGYVHTDDVDAAVARLVALGGAVHMPPADMGVGRIAMVSDPWGAVFYLMNPVPPPGQPDAKSDVFGTGPQQFRWNQLWAPDAHAAAVVYGDVAGWRQEGGMTMPDGRDYLFIHAGDIAIGAIGTMLQQGRGPRWEAIVGVDDFDRAIDAVTATGGQVDGNPGQVPGGDWSASVIDPQGARLSIVGLRKE
jgi:predicted enzyme related to lactoylglutathione lyase